MARTLTELNKKITVCEACPRLVKWRTQIARQKRAAYEGQRYWGKPLIGFGDPDARLVIVGLAPGAHGANRTGRVFTGDQSGHWLYRALFKAGFASQPDARALEDGLTLRDAYVTLVVRCVPPENKPKPQERDQCLPYLIEELKALKHCQVILALGGFAFAGIKRALFELGHKSKDPAHFQHALGLKAGPFQILASYHPSQQNTFTGKLTQPMFDEIFEKARSYLS